MEFITVNQNTITQVQKLAKKIWNDNYKQMISQQQIDYMLNLMYSQEKIETELTSGIVWKILKENNMPIAYLSYKKETEKVFLSKIYVDQSHQKKGIGKILLDDVYHFAHKNNLRKIYLTVNKNNSKATNFYHKNGFINKESKVFDIGNGYIMDDFIFEKDLTLPHEN